MNEMFASLFNSGIWAVREECCSREEKGFHLTIQA